MATAVTIAFHVNCEFQAESGGFTLFNAEVLGFRFGWEPPFAALRCGEEGAAWLRLAVRLLFDVVDAMESASEPRLAFDFCFAIVGRGNYPTSGIWTWAMAGWEKGRWCGAKRNSWCSRSTGGKLFHEVCHQYKHNDRKRSSSKLASI